MNKLDSCTELTHGWVDTLPCLVNGKSEDVLVPMPHPDENTTPEQWALYHDFVASYNGFSDEDHIVFLRPF